MKYQYTIAEQDFLDFQLYLASKSKAINNKKKTGWLLLSLGSVAAAMFFYYSGNIPLTIYCAAVAVVSYIFYPYYFKWRYKNHYQKYIRNAYSQRFGLVETIEFQEDCILTSDKSGEGKILKPELEEIIETEHHYFLKVSTGMYLIIPKVEIDDLDSLNSELEGIGVQISQDLNWKW